jgi:sugar (pentulose or hexulose) kinase
MVKWIIITVLGLIILGYMGIDIQKTVKAPTVQNNLAYGKEVAVHVWKNYLSEPAKFLWKFFIENIWKKAFEIINSKSKEVDGKKTSTNTKVLFSSISRGLSIPI